MNIAGLVVIAAGLVLVIIALRGSQSVVFPGLFPAANSSTPGYTPSQRTNGISPTNGSCPNGWILIGGKCYDPGALGI